MTAGYSGKPLATKLGITPTTRAAVVDPPDGFDELLGTPLPRRLPARRASLDAVVVFATHRRELVRRWERLTDALRPAGALWVAWPKKAAAKARAIDTDLTEDVVREVALPLGWVDTKVCAVDETWSGLRLVLRVERRPAG